MTNLFSQIPMLAGQALYMMPDCSEILQGDRMFIGDSHLLGDSAYPLKR